MMVSELFKRLGSLSALPGADRYLHQLALELAVGGAFVGGHAPARTENRLRLDDVVQLLTGTSVNAAEKELRYVGLTDGLPYIATKDVALNTGAIDYDNGVRIPEGEAGFKVAPTGSVLICAEGGSAGRKVGITDQPVCFGNKLYALVAGPNVLPVYLSYVLRSQDFYAQFQSNMSGIIGGVSLKKFRELVIPVPTLEDQAATIKAFSSVEEALANVEDRRLYERKAQKSAVTAALRALVEADDHAQVKDAWAEISHHFEFWFDDAEALKQLRTAIIDVAMKGLLVPEDGEPVLDTTLSSLTAFGPKNGFSPKPVSGPTDTKTMSLSAVTKGTFDASAFKYVQDRPAPDSDLWVRPNDILLQRANTIEYVGVSAVYTGALGEFIYPDLIMRITPKSGVDSRFLHLALSCSRARAHMRERASGTSGTMPKINQATVRSVPIRLPSFEQQQRIVAMVDSLLTVCTAVEQAIEDRTRHGLALLAAWAACGSKTDSYRNDSGGKVADSAPDAPREELQSLGSATVGRPFDLSLRHDDDRAFEAVLVSAVVSAFYEKSEEPLGNFRLQKAVYFARRRMGDSRVNSDYLRKAAGPYNPKMRYSGGIAVAKAQGWIKETKGRFGFGHIRGSNAAYAKANKEIQSIVNWVRDTFALRKNDDWERLATVDYAAWTLGNEGQPVTPKRVLDYISDLDIWRHKIAKLNLTEFSVQSAMLELSKLFATDLKASKRVCK
ncbi:restriction endonuclease subunit S [Paraburkholderia sediminicola]|uniref:restriction endonuclease subunit S n=1 Tax=Paraburkholderia sediminicola TaxID=458836 RepID=UPI0038BD6C2C